MNATGGMSGPQSDEAKQKMQEALKNMSPEQRERVEKMMKQRQSGSQQ
jgi:coenzyme F420-reducing hydrogenase alpha subunit